MAQIAKAEAKVEISCPPAKVYDFFKYNINSIVDLFPQVFKSAQLLEGEEGQVGNVRLVEFVIDKVVRVKVKIEEINDAERSITMRVVEGDLLQLYSSFSCRISVQDGCVNFVYEFEKINDSAPNPDNYVKLANQVAKGLNLYFLSK